MERYRRIEGEKGRKIGEGTYGVILKYEDIKTGNIVAIKKIKGDIGDMGIPTNVIRELSFLRELRHENIVQLQGCVESKNSIYMVFEFVDQDLRKYLQSYHGRVDIRIVKLFTFQLLSGLSFCHSRGVMHRDIKPHNLLISNDGKLKIADFGLARSYDTSIDHFTREVVTLWYRPPELLLGMKRYSTALDMWAVGVVVAEMATKQPLFMGDSEIDTLFKIFKVLGTPNEEIWPGVSALQDFNPFFPKWPKRILADFIPSLDSDGIQLIEDLLIYDPKKRATAKVALKSGFFKNMDEDADG